MKYLILLFIASPALATKNVSYNVILSEQEVLVLPNGSKIVLTDDDRGRGCEIWTENHGLVCLHTGSYISIGQYRVYCVDHDLKNDRAKLMICGPPLPKQRVHVVPHRSMNYHPRHGHSVLGTEPKAKQKPKPLVLDTPELKSNDDSSHRISPSYHKPKPDINAFELKDSIFMADHFEVLGEGSNPLNRMATKNDLPGDPGYSFTFFMFGENWQDVDIGVKNRRVINNFVKNGFREADVYQLSIHNPNQTWFIVTLFLVTGQGYQDCGWQWIAPQTQKRLSLSLDKIFRGDIQKIGLRVACEIGNGNRKIRAGHPFDIHIIPEVPLPSFLRLAEAEILNGGISATHFREYFCIPIVEIPKIYRHRFYIVKGLYSWRVGLGMPDSTRWQRVMEDAFSDAYKLSQEDPFYIYPKEWGSKCHLVWMLTKKKEITP